jgi:NAD(P)-dependent dehydrogenase (short-subunit alcohol dehydrogenase family)
VAHSEGTPPDIAYGWRDIVGVMASRIGASVQCRCTAAIGTGFGTGPADGPALNVFVANARPDVQHFYRPVFDLAPEHWRAAMDPQATALLLCVREVAAMMEKGRRIVAVTYAGGAASSRCGSSSSRSARRR